MIRRRKHARQAMRSMQYIDFEGLHGALITDLSEGGAGVLAAVPLRAQQRVRCRLDLGNTTVAAEARIVSADNTGRAGLQFISMAEEERRQLRDWLFEHALSRGIEMAPVANNSDEEFLRELQEMLGPIGEAGPAWVEPAPVAEEPPQPRPPVTLTLDDLPSATAPALALVVRQARACARAQGAAIALARGAIMRCLARDGDLAPDIGVPLDSHSSFSGQCIRSATTLVCDDSERDTRVDAAACRQLEIRSILATPVRLGDRVVGVLEIFSSAPRAFGEDDIHDMERVAEVLSQFVARETARTAARRAAQTTGQPSAPAPAAAAPVSLPPSSKVTPITAARSAAAASALSPAATPASTGALAAVAQPAHAEPIVVDRSLAPQPSAAPAATPASTGALAAVAESAHAEPVVVDRSPAPQPSAPPAATPQLKPQIPSSAPAKAPAPVSPPRAGAESVAQELRRQVSTEVQPSAAQRPHSAATVPLPAASGASSALPPSAPPPQAAAAAAASASAAAAATAHVSARPSVAEPARSAAVSTPRRVAFSIFGEDGVKRPAHAPASAAWLKPALAAGIVLTISAAAFWAWRHHPQAPAATDTRAAASPAGTPMSTAAPVMTPVYPSNAPVPGPTPALLQPRARAVAPAITLPSAARPRVASPDVAPPSLAVAPARGVLDALAGASRAVPVLSENSSAARPSSVVREARLLSSIRPTYPEAARRMGVSGDVMLTLQVGEDGKVKAVQTRSGNPILADAAAQIVRLWRYEPATLDGKPVPSSVEVNVKFTNPR